MTVKYSAPFPYFGGKARVAGEVWKRFGEVNTYIEPFCGSLAVLLHQNNSAPVEIVNDMDGLLVNFWRATKLAPEEVATFCDFVCSEIDLQARHNWVTEQKDDLAVKMRSDPDYFDPKIAGYWVYVKGCLVGGRGSFQEKIGPRVPLLGQVQGIFARSRREDRVALLRQLSARLKHVRICSGDWARVVTRPPLKHNGTPTAVFLDPPYQDGEWDDGAYEHSGGVFDDVRKWAIENGDDPDLRIALCGYEGIKMPDNWVTYRWETGGGLAQLGNGRGLENAKRETIWFSPHCLNPEDPDKFEEFFFG